MYSLVRPLLFSLNSEISHQLTLGLLGTIAKSSFLLKPFSMLAGADAALSYQPVKLMGLKFKNPVGLAAGLDKNARACDAFAAMGFGFIELGTVTPLAQPGNAKPRLFRLPEHQAIINRFGFNSEGLEPFLKNFQTSQSRIVKGINIGKNAATPWAQASEDYLVGLEAVYPHADYITINISSPNTKDLRKLQQVEVLNRLLNTLHQARQKQADKHGKQVPLVVKVAPDINQDEIAHIARLLLKNSMDGVISSNTTTTRAGIMSHPLASEKGGLSGTPVREMSTTVVHQLYQILQGEIPIIGVGGIDSPESAHEKFQAGAQLIQLYTGLIYQGPKLVRQILNSFEAHKKSN